MARFPKGLLDRLRQRPDPFTRGPRDGMDLLSTNGYDMSPTGLGELRADVEKLIQRLGPGAVDAYSEEVLDSWLDARERQLVAILDGEREDRQAVAEALVGIAREEVARRKSRYEADLTRLREAREAVEVARSDLAGSRGVGPFAESPDPIDIAVVGSTLGPVDLVPYWDADQHVRPDPDPTPIRPDEEHGHGPHTAT